MTDKDFKSCVYCGVTMQAVKAVDGIAYLHKGACILKDNEFLITQQAYKSMVSGDFGRTSSITLGAGAIMQTGGAGAIVNVVKQQYE